MRAQLDANAAQHQQPQDHHQREVEAAEAGGIEQGEGEVERAAGGEQPDFVAIPYRTDGAQDLSAIVGGFARAQVNGAGAEIEAIEHHVGRHHDGHDHEP